MTRWNRVFCNFSKLCAKDPVPKSTGDAKTLFVILVMMLQMIFLHFLDVGWQLGVMKSIMHHVVANVHEESSTDESICNGWWEKTMSKLSKRVRKEEK